MLPNSVQEALNDQINAEFNASYSYLAMSAHCKHENFHGFAKWLEVQSQEEYGHAMKLCNFLLVRNCKVDLRELPKPKGDFTSLVDVFEVALGHEKRVSQRIDALYELAFKEKAFAALVELQWFITEQVEEEQTFGTVLSNLKLLQDDPAAILDLDREMGTRTAASEAGAT